MIIDEPELHIHPQLQKELAILLNQLSEQNGTQFFLSTYSALFINEENITNVYRFQNENNTDETQIFNPRLHIASDDAKLVHLLRYENLSKIFFVDKIILVEGDSDSYFFAHYLKRLQEQPGREGITGTYELININGKGSYKSRHKFLNKF
jgi:predicted ATP-dependent endonuclease of OLD family